MSSASWFGAEDYDGGRMLIPLQSFAHAASEILLCFSGRSFPYLVTTFRPSRLTRPLRADKSYANDWLWRVVNVGLLFELPKPSGNVTSHRVLLSLREGEVGARSRWPRLAARGMQRPLPLRPLISELTIPTLSQISIGTKRIGGGIRIFRERNPCPVY